MSFKKGAKYSVNQKRSKKMLEIKSNSQPKIYNEISQILYPKKDIKREIWKKYLTKLIYPPPKIVRCKEEMKMCEGSNKLSESKGKIFVS